MDFISRVLLNMLGICSMVCAIALFEHYESNIELSTIHDHIAWMTGGLLLVAGVFFVLFSICHTDDRK